MSSEFWRDPPPRASPRAAFLNRCPVLPYTYKAVHDVDTLCLSTFVEITAPYIRQGLVRPRLLHRPANACAGFLIDSNIDGATQFLSISSDIILFECIRHFLFEKTCLSLYIRLLERIKFVSCCITFLMYLRKPSPYNQ